MTGVDLDEVRRLYVETDDSVDWTGDPWDALGWLPSLVAEVEQLRAEIERLTVARADLPGAVETIVFGTNIARSLIWTEKPEALVALTAQRIWSNLDAYFTCGDWPDRRRTAEEIDAEEADYRAAQPARKQRRPGGAR